MDKIELLAPGGDIDSIKAAIVAGADAVYCGLDKFNARNRAANISYEALLGILRLAHKNDCKVFLTLNIIILESEIPSIVKLLNKLVNTSLDGLIIQDFGMYYLLNKYFKNLEIHASTQLTTHNKGQILFLSKLNTKRVNLSRELSLTEIKDLTIISHKKNIETEVFVHGSSCVSFSGICYISSVNGGNSGNRGRCSQPCRAQYLPTKQGKNFPLNIKDKSAFFDLKDLYDAKVDSIKIEGRIKKYHYVYTVVNTWRKQLDSFYNKNKLIEDNSDLYRVFNRDFSNAFLKGKIDKDMFIDNPRDNSAKHFLKLSKSSSIGDIEKIKQKLYDEKTEIIVSVKDKIKDLSIEKLALIIEVSGCLNTQLEILVKKSEASFIVSSKSKLTKASKYVLNQHNIEKKLKSLNNEEFYIEKLDLESLEENLFIPFRELDLMKKEILYLLNDGREIVSPVDNLKIDFGGMGASTGTLPIPPNKANLSILISSEEDLYLSKNENIEVFFQLPDSFKNNIDKFIEIFFKNKKIIPWFGSVLIGGDYEAAVKFIEAVNPKLIVTNNIGIAYVAYEKEISWIAGPYLNIVNSLSLLALKENFNCYGSFVSNEINKNQIKKTSHAVLDTVKNPENLKLYYSIYHPILLMTTRQCFFHQVTGCPKSIMDGVCIETCNKSSSITNLKEESLFIKKTEGNYHRIYNDNNFLNTDIIKDLEGIFSNFFIDLRDIKTATNINVNKEGIVKLFREILSGNSDSENKVKEVVSFWVNTQYKKGL